MYLAPDGRSLYWMIGEITGVREQSGMEGGTFKVLYYPAVAKIDLARAKLSNFAKFGNEQYFLNNTTPQLPMGGKTASCTSAKTARAKPCGSARCRWSRQFIEWVGLPFCLCLWNFITATH